MCRPPADERQRDDSAASFFARRLINERDKAEGVRSRQPWDALSKFANPCVGPIKRIDVVRHCDQPLCRREMHREWTRGRGAGVFACGIGLTRTHLVPRCCWAGEREEGVRERSFAAWQQVTTEMSRMPWSSFFPPLSPCRMPADDCPCLGC